MDIGYTWYSHNTITWHYLDQGTLTNHAHDSTIVPAHMVDSRLSHVTKCVSQPAICQHVMHSEPVRQRPSPRQCPVSRLHPNNPSSIAAAREWGRVTGRGTHLTLSHHLLTSLLSRHVHQPRPLVQLSRVSAEQPVACDAATQATIHNIHRGERERETGTQSGCQLKL